MDIILAYIIIIVLFAIFPIVLDIILAYRSHNKTQKLIIEKASMDKLQKYELQELLKESSKPPPGVPGLARASMALTVILILGVAIFHLLVNDGSGANSQIINNVLSILAGLLAAITGFYFGGRATEKKPEETERKKET